MDGLLEHEEQISQGAQKLMYNATGCLLLPTKEKNRFCVRGDFSYSDKHVDIREGMEYLDDFKCR